MANNFFVIRPSMMASWSACALRAAVQSWPYEFINRGYTLNELRDGMAGAIGSAVHASAKCMLKTKMQKGTIGDINNAIEFGINTFEEKCKEGEGLEPDELTPNRSIGNEQIARITKVYAREVAYKVSPYLVESRLQANHQTHAGWKFSGAMDLVTKEFDVPDVKTGKRANYGMQVGTYSLILKANKIPARSLYTVGIQRPKKGDPDPEVTIDTYDEMTTIKNSKGQEKEIKLAELQAYKQSLRIIRDFTAFLESGKTHDIPQNPSDVLCKAKFCPAFGTPTCQSWKQNA